MSDIATADRRLTVALTEARNINNAANEELGYLKAIMAAIALMAEKDSHGNKGEIVALAKCAHWIAENLESNVDYFCERMSGEVH